MKMKDWCADMIYLYQERLGILCGSETPTEDQIKIATDQVVSWKKSRPVICKCKRCGKESELVRDELGLVEKIKSFFVCDACNQKYEDRKHAKRQKTEEEKARLPYRDNEP